MVCHTGTWALDPAGFLLGVFFLIFFTSGNWSLQHWLETISARHRGVADCLEVADSIDASTCPQKTADIDGLRYSPDDSRYGLATVHTSLYVRVRWNWVWDLFLGLRSPGTDEGGDCWRWPMGVKAENSWGCHRKRIFARILGILTISFQ